MFSHHLPGTCSSHELIQDDSLNTILCVAGSMYYQWRSLVSGALSIARFCVIWENGLNKAGISEGGEDE